MGDEKENKNEKAIRALKKEDINDPLGFLKGAIADIAHDGSGSAIEGGLITEIKDLKDPKKKANDRDTRVTENLLAKNILSVVLEHVKKDPDKYVAQLATMADLKKDEVKALIQDYIGGIAVNEDSKYTGAKKLFPGYDATEEYKDGVKITKNAYEELKSRIVKNIAGAIYGKYPDDSEAILKLNIQSDVKKALATIAEDDTFYRGPNNETIASLTKDAIKDNGNVYLKKDLVTDILQIVSSNSTDQDKYTNPLAALANMKEEDVRAVLQQMQEGKDDLIQAAKSGNRELEQTGHGLFKDALDKLRPHMEYTITSAIDKPLATPKDAQGAPEKKL